MSGSAAREIDRLSLGRRLTEVTDASVAEILRTRGDKEMARAGRVPRLGITGPPGVGKSTLISALAKERLQGGRRIGIVAIDPTSPLSGGSILGDRVRMDDVAAEDGLFLRSVPSRLSGDGLTDNLPDLLAAMETEPFDEIWVETVGVGQAAYGVRRCVDTVLVLIAPGSGDTIQAMKAGILEIGDVYAVTKTDRDQAGAEQIAAEVMATMSGDISDRRPPVLLVSAHDGTGVVELSTAIDDHGSFLDRSGRRAGVDPDLARYDLERLLTRRVRQLVDQIDPVEHRTTLASAYSAVVDGLATELEKGLRP